MTEIEPCPFCESQNTGVRRELEGHCAECGDCNATGPTCDTKEAAIAAWNALSRRLRAADQMSQGCRATEMHIERQADLYDSWKDCAISISDLVSELAKAYEKSRSE